MLRLLRYLFPGLYALALASAVFVSLLGLAVMSPAQEQRSDPQPAAPARWSFLPKDTYRVWLSPGGQVWRATYSPGEKIPLEAFQHSVEQVHASKADAFHGGYVFLLDRGGRFWGSADATGLQILYGYDGKTWVTRGAADGPHQPSPYRGAPAFDRSGWEDSAGDVFFSDGEGVHWMTPLGQWNYQPLYDAKTAREYGDWLEVRHAEGPAGVTYAWSGGSVGKHTAGFFRFDSAGRAWTHETWAASAVDALIPLPDGSLLFNSGQALLDEEGQSPRGDIARRWPRESDPAAQVPAIVRLLDHGDFKVREGASRGLAALGPRAEEAMLRSFDAAAQSIPEVRTRLQEVLRQFKQEGQKGSDAARPARNPKDEIYGGHLSFDGCALLLKRRDGSTLLHVRNCDDYTAGRHFFRALVSIDRNGVWSAQALPWADLADPRHATLYEAPDARLWMVSYPQGVFHLDLDGPGPARLMQAEPPEYQEFSDLRGLDRRGRAYLNYSLYHAVLDESIPEQKPELAIGTWDLYGGATAGPGGVVWASLRGGPDTPGGLPAFCRRRAGRWEPLPDLPRSPDSPYGPVVRSHALPSGAVLTYFYKKALRHDFEYDVALLDGKTWLVSRTGEDLVRDHHDALARLLTPGAPVWTSYGSQPVADATGNIWLDVQPAKIFPAGGKALEDAGKFFTAAGHSMVAPTIAAVFDGGRSVMLRELEPGEHPHWSKLWLVRPRAEGFDVELAPPGPTPETLESLSDATGGAWAAAPYWGDPAETALFLKDGKITVVNNAGRPALTDAQGRVWFVCRRQTLRGQVVRVKAGDAWAQIELPDFHGELAQSPDGRIWALLQGGLCELRVEGTGGTLRVTEAHRWAGGVPYGFGLTMVCCDDSNGLWLAWQVDSERFAGLLRRITLPPPAR